MTVDDSPHWYTDEWEPCSYCDGEEGWTDIEGDWIECPACEGSGCRWVGVEEEE